MNDEQIRTETEPAEEIAAKEETRPEEAPAEEAGERIRALEEELRRTKEQFALRERRLCCVGYLQKQGLREELAEILVTEADGDMAQEEILRRVALLAEAVEEAAVRQLRSRAVSMSPRSGTEPLLTGDLIRQTPVARLAEMMGK